MKEIFNEEQKQVFLRDFETDIALKQTYTKIFRLISEYELILNKDVCYWSPDSISVVLGTIFGAREFAKNQASDLIDEYISWCEDRNIVKTKRNTRKTKNNKQYAFVRNDIINPLHLDLYLKSICRHDDPPTADILIKGFIWLAFSGVPEQQAVEISRRNINFKSMKIETAMMSYPIYQPEAFILNLCNDSKKLQTFQNAFNRVGVPTFEERQDGDLVLRGTKRAKSNPTLLSFRTRVSNLVSIAVEKGKVQFPITYNSVWTAGEFYRAFQYEQIYGKVSMIETARKAVLMKESANDLTDEQIEYRSIRKSNSLLSNYNDWKMQFMI